MNSDKQNARIESDQALKHAFLPLIKDDTQLFKEYSDNEGFKRFVKDTAFALTYD
jgi:type I restriction enzyme R subunit